MANLPEGLAQFEYHKMQLIGSLSHVADSMRNCAQMADTFAQMVSQFPYNHPIIPNGQFAVPAALPPPPPPMLGRGKRKAGDEADGRKSKRVKKPKDPNAPKRPASSYLLFQNEIRQELKAKNPTLPNNELLGVIAKMWKDMPKEEKDAYEARQKLAKDQWLADKTAYKASQGGAPTDPTAATTPVDADVVPKPGDVETSEEESSDEEESSSSSDESSVENKLMAPKKSKKANVSKEQVKRAQKTKNKA